MAMKPRAMKKKMMRGGGAVKQSVAKRVQSAGFTPLPSPSPTRRSNTEAFDSRTELNRKAQEARAAGPAVNKATTTKRANAAAALERKRKNAKKSVAKKSVGKKSVGKKLSKSDPKREVAYVFDKIDDSGMYKPKRRVSPSSKAIGAIGSAIKGSSRAASGSAKMMRGGMKKPVAKMRGGGLKKK